jgi:integrative and conjugative element protein (TIGR02256 family)
MQYVDSWATPDRRVMVLFSEAVIATFNAHRQLLPGQTEAGGVLLGRRRGKHFEVVHATQPLPTDKRTRTSFVRESFGHQEQAIELWKASRREVGYLGEWHSHPETCPSPSGVDVKQWQQHSRDTSNESPLLAVITGTEQLYVALLRHEDTHVRLDCLLTNDVSKNTAARIDGLCEP